MAPQLAVDTGGDTVRLNVQDRPPMLNAKLAVPAALGVPVIVYASEPLPLANVPAARLAVRPVTPVELTL